jgi:hypothetical protein
MTTNEGRRSVVEKARAEVEQLMADFLADPSGEAAQMARTFLLGCMLKEQTQEEEGALRELQEHKEARRTLEEDVGALAAGRLSDRTRNRRLADKLRKARMRNGDIGGYEPPGTQGAGGEETFRL